MPPPPWSTASEPDSPATAEKRRQLEAHEWVLSKVYDDAGHEQAGWRMSGMDGGPAMRMGFYRHGNVTARVCNFISLDYALAGNDGMQMVGRMQTMAACSVQGLMDLEARVGRQLPQVRRYALTTGADAVPRLELRFADGSRWELEGRAKPPRP
ncbi:META domain-containing protein [Acidovorax sp. GBBC 3334]|uniref:META domain-containing protein n=1 Tax=Acidovorax sp. GBBC 3334 TaxID=2940496 RepID=UPI00230454EA|nr:META domain-containing protein [Acidovorax sp. GBBC 3334]MDA8453659.1 META domain-containing protein [Acidovorax sp. GBBC 3334]